MSRIESFFSQNPQSRIVVVASLVVIAALTRLMPHPWNFSPIESIALFGGAVLASKRAAILIPLAAMLLSDLCLQAINGTGFHGLMWLVYGLMAATALLGRLMRGKVSAARVAGFGLLSAVIFFLATNFAVWAGSGMYAPTMNGLMQCYVAAIPFFKNQLAGVAVYLSVLFGAWAWLNRESPSTAMSRV